MSLRVASSLDALGIASVQVAAWQAAYRGLMDPSLLDSLSAAAKVRAWEGFIAAPDQQVWVFEDDGRVTAYAHAGPSRDEPGSALGEVSSVYVAPSHWRRGQGTALLRTAEAALAARGCEALTLWVLEANDRARSFYEALGYAPDGAAKRHPKSGLVEIRYRRALRPGRPPAPPPGAT